VSPTNAPAFNLLVRGADIVQGPTASRAIDLTANDLIFNATAPTGDFQLNTTVNSLTADVGNTVALNVDQTAGALTLRGLRAQTIDVQSDGALGTILDDGDDSTALVAQNVRLGSIGAIGSTTGTQGIDVNASDLSVFSGTGNVVI